MSSVFTSPPTHSIGYMGDGFYRSKDPTNSIKVLKEQIVKGRKLLADEEMVWHAYMIKDVVMVRGGVCCLS